MERHLFPAANTPAGFYSNFKNVADLKNCHCVHIKGGSGCGKSTFMKKVAKIAEDKGYFVEYLHCSSDPDSLDGIHITEIKSIILDSTSPHIMDPFLTGAGEMIFNTGDFLGSNLINHKEELIALNREKSKYFQDCYRYLGAIKCLYPENTDFNIRLIHNIADAYTLKQTYKKTGKSRKLFASGITPKGCVNFLESVLTGKIIAVNDAPGSSELLKEISLRANVSGFDTDLYFCPMFPDSKIEHLVIKDADLSFTTVNQFHSLENIDKTIHIPDTKTFSPFITELLNSAINSLKQAKLAHEKIEKIYIKSMDFSLMDSKLPDIITFLNI